MLVYLYKNLNFSKTKVADGSFIGLFCTQKKAIP